MIEFGRTLREAREAKGFTIGQIAERTHMMTQIVEGLEKEDFSRIVAPIYGRGFVKLYCEVVGLEAKPLIDEFMEIYNGHREPVIRTRDIPAAEPSEPIDMPPPIVEPVIQAQHEPVSAPDPITYAEDRVVDAEPPVEDPLPEALRGPSRYATPMPIDDQIKRPSFSLPSLPPHFWRIAVLVLVTAAIILLIVMGVRALYRATMTGPEAESSAAIVAETTPAADDAAALPRQTDRTPLPAKPLYID